MRIDSDIDIDVADRAKLLSVISHIPASMRNVSPIRKHPSGIYVTDIPYDPVNDMSSLHYSDAEKRGYFKLDILNVHVYEHVKNEEHLVKLMAEPDWDMLKDRATVEKLIHLNNSYDIMVKMPEPINSIPRLAMFLAVMRPSKRHLIGQLYKEISKTVWEKDNSGYVFRKAHAVAYAQLVAIHMNLLKEQMNNVM